MSLACSLNKPVVFLQVGRLQRSIRLYGKYAPKEAISLHRQKVSQVSEAVKDFYSRGQFFRISHGSTNSTRQSSLGRDPKKVVDTSQLSNVLHIDTERRTALVEPNVPMDLLIEATLAHQLIPPVVMEFPGITVGGGFNGTSGESSSFRHGFFDRTLDEIEMVLADGEIIACSDQQNSDLFRGAAGALGTFGVTTLLKIRLIPASKYVETTYHPVHSINEALTLLRQTANPDDPSIDYIDGIMFSPSHGVIITGRLTNETDSTLPVTRFSSPSDEWFYLHAHTKTTPTKELVPLGDYLFRYDRGGFWVGLAAFSYFKSLIPFTKTTRSFLDDFLHTRMLYRALHASGEAERMIIQDLALPYRSAERFVEFCARETGIWPLWFCPLRQSPGPTMHPHSEGEGQLVNIGLWGMGPEEREGFRGINREIEKMLAECGGMRWLYAQTFCGREEFWGDFDYDWYAALRKKYRAEGLPDVFEKISGRGVKVERAWWKKIWPVAGIIGLREAIRSKDYLKARGRKW
ncbi:putative FAD binding protein [Piedraia hortae CBS 480.64]|uniref:Delta(24)-sterol reductase n=1 Tax=Piedraia hortae CBS 480.64 TaxID=1314780 RepID=A0A6A7C735_9PEZI|nr:putative FAD binding protein [Piedraia hortae CBS 480.64]